MVGSQNLAIIPARGGSKGIPRKNLRLLAGKPLLAHTIELALRSNAINRVIVSTDDTEIAQVSEQYGAEVVWRPVHISGDTASSESALIHVLHHLEQGEGYKPDLVVFLQCTSPIRRVDDIDKAIQLLLKTHADSLLSVTPSHRFIWQEVNHEAKAVNYDFKERPRRQDREPEYMENGSIYVFKPWVLQQFNNRLGGKIVLYKMGPFSEVDIDTYFDFQICEMIFKTDEFVQYYSE